MSERSARDAQVVRVLREMQREWEATFDGEDAGLYSLGLRHAIDVIEGRDPRSPNREWQEVMPQ